MNLVRMRRFNRISKDEIFSQQFQGRGILQATCLEHAYQPAPILYLLMKIPGAINFPSWKSRVRIPSPAFFGKFLGFNIVQRVPFLAGAVVGSLVSRPDNILRSKPATVFYSWLSEQTRGRFAGKSSKQIPALNAGHRFFLYSWLYHNWLVTAAGVSPPAPQPCRPILFGRNDEN